MQKMFIFTNRKARRLSCTVQSSLLLMHSLKRLEFVLFLLFQLALIVESYPESDDSHSKNQGVRPSCRLYKEVGPNDLSINDIVVKNEANIACIKARFSLTIKVEAPSVNPIILNPQSDNDLPDSQDSTGRIVLGYLPLDNVVGVEDNCPSSYSEPNHNLDNNNNNNNNHANGNGNTDQGKHSKLPEGPEELVMIVRFECGKLAFHFKREDTYYLSAIKGVVNLDSNTITEFYSGQNMFYTSDLNHHFKFNELVEVYSTAKTKGFYYLAANFYNLEFETFRNISSRSFIRPADDNSKPFLESC